jgi:hypothetical protein
MSFFLEKKKQPTKQTNNFQKINPTQPNPTQPNPTQPKPTLGLPYKYVQKSTTHTHTHTQDVLYSNRLYYESLYG